MTDWAIDRILPRGGVLYIRGPAKSGKSLLATNLATLLAGTGGQFLNRFEVRPGNVMYLHGVHGDSPANIRFRIRRMAEAPDSLRLVFGHLPDLHDAGVLSREIARFKSNYLIVDPVDTAKIDEFLTVASFADAKTLIFIQTTNRIAMGMGRKRWYPQPPSLLTRGVSSIGLRRIGPHPQIEFLFSAPERIDPFVLAINPDTLRFESVA